MALFKRFGWFFLVNIAVMITISIVTSSLGLNRYVTDRGLNYGMLMAYCLVWGMAGSFISLAISRIMAKWTMGVKLVDPAQASGEARWLLSTVYDLSAKAGIKTMPQVGIYESPEVNAFATGPTRNRALVAVSSGLLYGMSKEEVEGVLAHEVAHVANGDMVTMTLVQGVVNAFVMFFARIVAFAVGQSVKEESRHMVELITTIVLQILFGILGQVVVSAFSRYREFRADAGGATLGGRQKMISALERLRGATNRVDDSQQAVAAFKISGRPSKFLALFSTHPPLEERIARLRAAKV
ncbi:MAG: protease HtpX [Silvanigrellales bacterium]|jgi:heat shock protein HtpX|nr:protease HtpX [Silvanigrellales bacterium]